VNLLKSTMRTPCLWHSAMASRSSSNVPRRGSGLCDGFPWSCPPSFQPTNWIAPTPCFLHTAATLGRSTKRRRSSSSGELMCNCCHACGSRAHAGGVDGFIHVLRHAA